jgi:hypothetical protein
MIFPPGFKAICHKTLGELHFELLMHGCTSGIAKKLRIRGIMNEYEMYGKRSAAPYIRQQEWRKPEMLNFYNVHTNGR